MMNFENVNVTISTKWGDNIFLLNDWLKPDLEKVFQKPPSQISNIMTGEILPHFAIPMAYRLNFVSQFYVNSGVCIPPWRTSRNEIILDRLQQSVINNQTTHIIKFGKYDLGFPAEFFSLQNDIGFHIDEMYLVDKSTRLAQKKVVNLSNLLTFSKTLIYIKRISRTNIKTATMSTSRNEKYWMRHLETFLPDIALGIEIERQYIRTNSVNKCYSIHKLENKDLFALTMLISLPDIEENMQIETKSLDLVHQTTLVLVALADISTGYNHLSSIIKKLVVYPE